MASMNWPLVMICVLCVALTFTTLMQFQRIVQLKQVLEKMAARLRIGQKGYDDLQAELQNITTERDNLIATKVEMEHRLAEGQKRVQTAESQIVRQRQLTQNNEENLKRLTSETEHWHEQSGALTSQLQELVEEKRQALAASAKQLEKELSEARQKFKQQEQQLRHEATMLREQLTQVEKEGKTLAARNTKLEEILGKVNPEEVRRNKVKAHRMEQLFTSMKSLKDMAEERNQNWEIALRELAAYIVNKPEIIRNKLTLPIGQLVGEALEKAGTSLIHDEFALGVDSGALDSRETADSAHGV